MYCRKCGSLLDDETQMCPNCGQVSKGKIEISNNSKRIIALVSVLIIVIAFCIFLGKQENVGHSGKDERSSTTVEKVHNTKKMYTCQYCGKKDYMYDVVVLDGRTVITSMDSMCYSCATYTKSQFQNDRDIKRCGFSVAIEEH